MVSEAANANKSSAPTIDEVPPRIQVIHFSVELPPSALQGPDEPVSKMPTPVDNVGVVGTITVLNKSAVIWYGWGRVVPAATTTDKSSLSANGVPVMGQVVMAMPRTKYSGAFSDSQESSCTQLVGGIDNDCLNANAMASRLSQKVGYPIVVTGGLSSESEIMQSLLAGVDHATAAQRATATAEREIGRILLEHKDSKSN
jgi:hypothetical protein